MSELHRLQSENTELKKKVAELEQRSKGGASGDPGELPTAISEYEETLRRLVQRTAMIVQAEKCVIMVRDRENEDLYARIPAFGMTEEQVKAYRVPTDTREFPARFTTAANRLPSRTAKPIRWRWKKT